jgi:hypothetical protein
LPTLTERPEEYQLYRAARTAPTEEERLRAAYRYLREVGQGPHTVQLRAWFTKAEERYYLTAFNSLPRLHAYVAALPRGPHIDEVRSRIDWLEQRQARRRGRKSLEQARFQETEARLAEAEASRRQFVATFRDWTERLSRISSFGEPTSELDHTTIFAFRLSAPRGKCRGDLCRKLLQPSYEVPGEGGLMTRTALLEVQLVLDRGRLSGARVAGPALFTRLAEALSLRALPSPSESERSDALDRCKLLVRGALEAALPAQECEVEPEGPALLERRCRGVRARMLAGADPSEDDVIEIEPWPVAASLAATPDN